MKKIEQSRAIPAGMLLDLERLVFLITGVFAMALTLLGIYLKSPTDNLVEAFAMG